MNLVAHSWMAGKEGYHLLSSQRFTMEHDILLVLSVIQEKNRYLFRDIVCTVTIEAEDVVSSTDVLSITEGQTL